MCSAAVGRKWKRTRLSLEWTQFWFMDGLGVRYGGQLEQRLQERANQSGYEIARSCPLPINGSPKIHVLHSSTCRGSKPVTSVVHGEHRSAVVSALTQENNICRDGTMTIRSFVELTFSGTGSSGISLAERPLPMVRHRLSLSSLQPGSQDSPPRHHWKDRWR